MKNLFASNLAFLVLANGLSSATSLVLLLYFGAALGPAPLGLIQLAISINSILFALADAGYSVRGLAMVGRTQEPQSIVANVILLRTTSSLIFVVGVIAANLIGAIEQSLFLLLFVLGINNLIMSLALDWLFVGLNRASVVAWFSLLQNAAAVIVVVLAIGIGELTPLILPLALVAGSAASVWYPMRVFRRTFPQSMPRVKWPGVISYAKSAIPFGLGALLLAGYQNVDSFFLTKLGGVAALGHYAVVYRFYLFSNNVLGVVFRAWLPSRQFRGQPAFSWKELGLVVVIMLVAAVAMWIALPWIIGKSLGPEFAVSVGLANGLPGLVFLSGVNQYLVFVYFLPADLSARFMRIVAFGAALHVALDLALVGLLGAWGALIANAGRELLTIALLLGSLLRLRKVTEA